MVSFNMVGGGPLENIYMELFPWQQWPSNLTMAYVMQHHTEVSLLQIGLMLGLKNFFAEVKYLYLIQVVTFLEDLNVP